MGSEKDSSLENTAAAEKQILLACTPYSTCVVPLASLYPLCRPVCFVNNLLAEQSIKLYHGIYARSYHIPW